MTQLVSSNFYWTLLQPSTLASVFLIFGLLLLRFNRWRAGRWWLGWAGAFVFVPTLLPIAGILGSVLETHTNRPVPMPSEVTGIVVLGGAVRPPLTFAHDQLSLNDRAERVLGGAALARRYPNARVVFTGDGAATFFDIEDNLGLFDGIDSSRLEFVASSRSTYEDALLSVSQVQPQASETWLLVTSALHMPRALIMFQTQGWQVTPYPVDYRADAYALPSLAVGNRLAYLDEVVREWGALWIYYLSGRTQSLLPQVSL
ncbi:MAG: YdcF family protein [Deinococcota bacterium]